MDLNLRGKAVLCTGAAGGIGRHTARRFAEEGAVVACVDRDETALADLVKSLPGRGHLGIAQTLVGAETATQVVDQTIKSLGRIDVLVHMAAVLDSIELETVTEQQFVDHMSVNVTATFFLARASAEQMQRQGAGGRIIAMSSGSWLSGGLPTRLPYATTKGAVTTMMRGLAKAYGPDGITVNTVAPGLIDTAMMRSGLDPQARAELELATPLRRFGEPDEVASVIVFLASGCASFVSGATVNVSGAYTLY